MVGGFADRRPQVGMWRIDDRLEGTRLLAGEHLNAQPIILPTLFTSTGFILCESETYRRSQRRPPPSTGLRGLGRYFDRMAFDGLDR